MFLINAEYKTKTLCNVQAKSKKKKKTKGKQRSKHLLYILEYDSDPLKAELSIKTSVEFPIFDGYKNILFQ